MAFKFALLVALAVSLASHIRANQVTFAPDATVRVDGKPFFPIGVWTYGINSEVLADLDEHHFNTVVGNGLKPTDLPALEKHGLMCIPPASDAWIQAAKNSPSLLTWYLTDEPEEHGVTPEQTHTMYEQLKSKDRNHPAGITHDMLIGPPKYVGSCDFTMTDVYPVTRNRDWPLNAVGRYTENTRKVHGEGWPNFTFIQTFGGPDSDAGQWAQPLPHEVRFMAFNALVHRASGILYFSYWPRDKTTWASVTDLNRDIERITPWLLADGSEKPATSSDAAIEVRAKQTKTGWLILATNSLPKPVQAHIAVTDMSNAELESGQSTVTATAGQWDDHFAPQEAKTYLTGHPPRIP